MNDAWFLDRIFPRKRHDRRKRILSPSGSWGAAAFLESGRQLL